MNKYYTRACNFYYGKNSKINIKKKKETINKSNIEKKESGEEILD